MSDSKRVTVVAASVASGALLSLLASVPAGATPQMVSQAKAAGFPAQNCQYCHTDKTPKKDTFKPDDLNERGKWLHAEKEKRNAKASNAAWLKEYSGK